MSNKCPICGNATERGACAICGYEISSDFIAYPTFQPAIESGKRFRTACQSRADNDPGRLLEQAEIYIKKAFELYQKAALQDHPTAQWQMGKMYSEGVGVKQNLKMAAYWYEKSAEQGNAEAQNRIGWCYDQGEGVDKDRQLAAYWYEQAAKQGHAKAQYNLGCCYDKGDGVKRDPGKAAYWFEKAAKQGYSNAQYNLGVYYAKGEGVEKDTKAAVYWYKQAAKQGDAAAQYTLGRRYENGSGVGEDLKEAAYWYKQAAKQGNKKAQAALDSLYKNNYVVFENDHTDKEKPADQKNDDREDEIKLVIPRMPNIPGKTEVKNLTEGRVAPLVKKYGLGPLYFVKGSASFDKKVAKAAKAYASTALDEDPLLMMDNTVFGSAKEGFVLTSKTLFYNDGIGHRGQCPIEKIEAAYVYTSKSSNNTYYTVLKIAPSVENGKKRTAKVGLFTSEKNEAEKEAAFWRELLNLPGAERRSLSNVDLDELKKLEKFFGK